MRHKKTHRKLGRSATHRVAMLNNMAQSLILHEQITTTLPKAKELRPYVEKIITLGKRADLHSYRTASKKIKDDLVLRKLFGDVAKRYDLRHGGYTRVIKCGFRYGDCAPMAIIELVNRKPEEKGIAHSERHYPKISFRMHNDTGKDD